MLMKCFKFKNTYIFDKEYMQKNLRNKYVLEEKLKYK